MANSVDPDQMPHSVASDLGLHCLLRPVCPITKDYYGMWINDITMWQHSEQNDFFDICLFIQVVSVNFSLCLETT